MKSGMTINLCRFLIQAGLDAFVAPSYGAQQALAKTLREQVLAYGQTEQQRLAAGMASKSIVACLDENFHGDQACLVAIEPASNFLLLEAYQQRRDAHKHHGALKCRAKERSGQGRRQAERGIRQHDPQTINKR